MTEATRAREVAGLTLMEAARRARVSVGYLRRVERHGASYCLAQRLSRLYECPIDCFLYGMKGGGTPKNRPASTRRRNRADAQKKEPIRG
jgi:hypothetical protein